MLPSLARLNSNVNYNRAQRVNTTSSCPPGDLPIENQREPRDSRYDYISGAALHYNLPKPSENFIKFRRDILKELSVKPLPEFSLATAGTKLTKLVHWGSCVFSCDSEWRYVVPTTGKIYTDSFLFTNSNVSEFIYPPDASIYNELEGPAQAVRYTITIPVPTTVIRHNIPMDGGSLCDDKPLYHTDILLLPSEFIVTRTTILSRNDHLALYEELETSMVTTSLIIWDVQLTLTRTLYPMT